ncbi:MAG TPA: hypothetical protein VFO01_16365 [Trebonia sp.]|nr:hypothetical protein [Trebonia sp.]
MPVAYRYGHHRRVVTRHWGADQMPRCRVRRRAVAPGTGGPLRGTGRGPVAI